MKDTKRRCKWPKILCDGEDEGDFKKSDQQKYTPGMKTGTGTGTEEQASYQVNDVSMTGKNERTNKETMAGGTVFGTQREITKDMPAKQDLATGAAA